MIFLFIISNLCISYDKRKKPKIFLINKKRVKVKVFIDVVGLTMVLTWCLLNNFV